MPYFYCVQEDSLKENNIPGEGNNRLLDPFSLYIVAVEREPNLQFEGLNTATGVFTNDHSRSS